MKRLANTILSLMGSTRALACADRRPRRSDSSRQIKPNGPTDLSKSEWRARPPTRSRRCGLVVRGVAGTGPRFGVLVFTLAICAGLTGCGFLKPAQSTTRHYVLTATPATGPAAAAATPLAVGLGQVKLPAYLFDTSLAVRKGTNEIVYLPSAQWAERLDTGFQRVLAANLALLLPSDRIRLSAWRSDEVAAELYVAIEQFDVDASGRGVLVAQWRVLAPAGEKTLKTGTSRLSRQGPPPDTGASGAVATLSELVTDFSRQLAQTLQESTAGQAGPVSR